MRGGSATPIDAPAPANRCKRRRQPVGGGKDHALGRVRERDRRMARAREGVEQDRRRRGAAHQPGYRHAVGPPDPHADGRAAIEADRPSIAKTVRGAGLERDASGRRILRWRRADQDIADIPGGCSVEQPARAGVRLPLALDQRHRRAEPRQCGIEHHQIRQLDTDAAEPHGKARRFAGRQHQLSAHLRQPRAQPADTDFVEHRDGGDVERELQRAAHGHRALEGQIEILRHIVAVARRSIVDQRLRMREPVLKGHAVNERFQRRTGRAQRLRHVNLAGAAFIEIIGRADTRADFTAGIIDRDDGDRNLRTERMGALARQLFQRALQIGRRS